MNVFEHWHPVLRARQLCAKPRGFKLHGQEFVAFRGGGGVGVLSDVCPHRRMRLSAGVVCGGRLRCNYHGWTFGVDGRGESPGTPKLHATAPGLEALEAHDAIWVRARGSARPMPAFDVAGFAYLGLLEHAIAAPLELVLDNFCEMEHTPTTHASFGYPLDRMHELQVNYEPTEKAVRVTNDGPTKRFPFPLAQLMGIGRRYHFYDDFTTHFSPVHNVVDQYWADPATRREARVRLRLLIFFTPAEEKLTKVFTHIYVKSRFPLPGGGVSLYGWLVRRMVNKELCRDRAMLESLASHETSLQGLKLSRFDRVLGLNRERLARVYRSEAQP